MTKKYWKKAIALALGLTMTVSAGIAVMAEALEEEESQLSLVVSEDEEESGVPEEGALEEETEAPVVYQKIEPTQTGTDGVQMTDVSAIVENVMPSIVSITETTVIEAEEMFYMYGMDEDYEVQYMGSGIIIAQNNSELLIATNYHNVMDATDLTVCFSVDADDPEDLLVSAKVKGVNKATDLAVIAVELSEIKSDILPKLKIATLGHSSNLKVGQGAIVIGNALGFHQTVTAGIISAVDCEVTTEIGTQQQFQVDAAVNFGCSGGAILNSRGEVIGITNAKDTINDAENMGYGIPIDTAIPILSELINRETRLPLENHGFIGVTVVPVSEEARTMYNMPAGAFVYEVGEGSAAAEAGIEKGNIIIALDGQAVESSDDLVDLVSHYAPGETVSVVLQVPDQKGYVEKVVEVTLQDGASESTLVEDAGEETGDGDLFDEKDSKGDRKLEEEFEPDDTKKGDKPSSGKPEEEEEENKLVIGGDPEDEANKDADSDEDLPEDGEVPGDKSLDNQFMDELFGTDQPGYNEGDDFIDFFFGDGF